MDTQALPSPSAWELDLGTARFTLTLSPGHYRGFAGEGALLGSLADDGLTADAELLGVLLAWSPRIDVGRMSAEAGLSPERTVLALIASGAVTPHDVCACPWWGRHRGTRGPCKHVLAARMAERPDEP